MMHSERLVLSLAFPHVACRMEGAPPPPSGSDSEMKGESDTQSLEVGATNCDPREAVDDDAARATGALAAEAVPAEAIAPPSTAAEEPPSTAGEAPPSTAEEASPSTTEEGATSTTEEAPPSTTEEVPPSTIEEAPPSTTDEAPPLTAAEVPPSTTDEAPPATTDEAPPEGDLDRPCASASPPAFASGCVVFIAPHKSSSGRDRSGGVARLISVTSQGRLNVRYLVEGGTEDGENVHSTPFVPPAFTQRHLKAVSDAVLNCSRFCSGAVDVDPAIARYLDETFAGSLNVIKPSYLAAIDRFFEGSNVAVLKLDSLLNKRDLGQMQHMFSHLLSTDVVQVAYFQGALPLQGALFDKLCEWLKKSKVWSINLGKPHPDECSERTSQVSQRGTAHLMPMLALC